MHLLPTGNPVFPFDELFDANCVHQLCTIWLTYFFIKKHFLVVAINKQNVKIIHASAFAAHADKF